MDNVKAEEFLKITEFDSSNYHIQKMIKKKLKELRKKNRLKKIKKIFPI
jgi:hypothetical protein